MKFKCLTSEFHGHNDHGAATGRRHTIVDWIRDNLGFTSLQSQRLDDIVAATERPRERRCACCWNGESAGEA